MSPRWFKSFEAGLQKQSEDTIEKIYMHVFGVLPSVKEEMKENILEKLKNKARDGILVAESREKMYSNWIEIDDPLVFTENGEALQAFYMWLNSEHALSNSAAEIINFYEVHLHQMFLVRDFWRRYLTLLHNEDDTGRLSRVFSRHSSLILALEWI